MDEITLAYLAGVIDSDGCIGIKKSTYAMRVRKDAGQPVYSESLTLKQVEPQAVDLFYECFGGSKMLQRPSAKRGKPLYTWHSHSAAAGRAIVLLRPYLRIKARQADNCIALRALIGQGRSWPSVELIEGEPLMPLVEFAQAVGCKPATIYQAARLHSIPSKKVGHNVFIPASFVPTYQARLASGGHAPRDIRITEAMEAVYLKAKELNRVGV